VAVESGLRGKGIARALVSNRLAFAGGAGLREVYLLTMTAARYFERFGFREVNRADVPVEIAATVEFSQACPRTATVMKVAMIADRHSTKGHDMDVKNMVRERYAGEARRVLRGMDEGRLSQKATCCGQEQPSRSELEAPCCGAEGSPSTQDVITSDLYAEADVEKVPLEAMLASLGCGNPTALAELREGEVVLDLGSGGGIDVILSAKRVGAAGRAYGLDMTDEMLEVARQNALKAGVANVEFLKGEIENVPLPDESVDVVISNCVINLSPDKPRVLREAYRVLKAGGRLAVADIVARGPIPEAIRKDMEMWTGCVAGALEDGEYRKYLAEAGFEDAAIEPTRVFSVERGGCCSGSAAGAGVDSAAESGQGVFMSAFIRAAKPRRAA
jgi:SAM-dependent methyltransferase